MNEPADPGRTWAALCAAACAAIDAINADIATRHETGADLALAEAAHEVAVTERSPSAAA